MKRQQTDRGSLASALCQLLSIVLATGAAWLVVNTAPRMSKSDLEWNIAKQAAAHSTVLSLLATVTAVFLYMTLQWSVAKRQSTPRVKLDGRMLYFEAAAWGGLLFALTSFGIAAVWCATMAGLKEEDGVVSMGPYIVMTNIYCFYLWGIFLATLGAMYASRLFGLSSSDTVLNRVILTVIAVLGLIVVHLNAEYALRELTGSDKDWLLYVAVALVAVNPIRLFKAQLRKVDSDKSGRLAWWTCGLALVVLVILGMGNAFFTTGSWLRGPTFTGGAYVLILFYLSSGIAFSVIISFYAAIASASNNDPVPVN